MEHVWEYFKWKSLYLLIIHECKKVKFKKEPSCNDLVGVFGKKGLKRTKGIFLDIVEQENFIYTARIIIEINQLT